MASEFLEPSPALLVKLGSIIVHLDEATKPGGHEYDLTAAAALLDDPEVVQWLKQGTAAAFLPMKRSKRW